MDNVSQRFQSSRTLAIKVPRQAARGAGPHGSRGSALRHPRRRRHLAAMISPSPSACEVLARRFHWLNINYTSRSHPPLIRLHPICSRRSIPVSEHPRLCYESRSATHLPIDITEIQYAARWKWTWPLSSVSNNGQHKSLQSAVGKSYVAGWEGRQWHVCSSFFLSFSHPLLKDTWAAEGCFQQHTRPGKHVCCVMEKSKSLPANQFSAPCMLPRAEWQQKIQPQTNKRAQRCGR